MHNQFMQYPWSQAGEFLHWISYKQYCNCPIKQISLGNILAYPNIWSMFSFKKLSSIVSKFCYFKICEIDYSKSSLNTVDRLYDFKQNDI